LTSTTRPRSDDGVQWFASERPTGTYRRRITLGEGIATDAISADYDNGVLTIAIPVAEQAKPRKVEIGANGSSKHTIEASSSSN